MVNLQQRCISVNSELTFPISPLPTEFLSLLLILISKAVPDHLLIFHILFHIHSYTGGAGHHVALQLGPGDGGAGPPGDVTGCGL